MNILWPPRFYRPLDIKFVLKFQWYSKGKFCPCIVPLYAESYFFQDNGTGTSLEFLIHFDLSLHVFEFKFFKISKGTLEIALCFFVIQKNGYKNPVLRIQHVYSFPSRIQGQKESRIRFRIKVQYLSIFKNCF